MDRDKIRVIFRILIALSITALLVAMSLIIVRYRSQMRERSEHIAALSAEASAYEAELTELRRRQETEEMRLYTPDGPGVAVISFLIDGEKTLATARKYGDAYGFRPAILLRTDEEKLDKVIDAISGSGLDVILYGRGVDSAARLRELQERLEEAGCGNTSSFLLRSGDDTPENRKILKQAGITTLFLYGDTLRSEITEDGTAELNYSYINKSSYSPANRLSDLGGSEQGLLFAVDLLETTVTERQLDDIIATICEEADRGHITVSTVDGAVATVKERQARQEANVNEFLKLQEERSARIQELEKIIKEIYSHWDD